MCEKVEFISFLFWHTKSSTFFHTFFFLIQKRISALLLHPVKKLEKMLNLVVKTLQDESKSLVFLKSSIIYSELCKILKKFTTIKYYIIIHVYLIL